MSTMFPWAPALPAGVLRATVLGPTSRETGASSLLNVHATKNIHSGNPGFYSVRCALNDLYAKGFL